MKLYVPLTTEEVDRLCELARSERRRPQDQAALLLSHALLAAVAGALPTANHGERDADATGRARETRRTAARAAGSAS